MNDFEVRYRIMPDLNVIVTRTKGKVALDEFLREFSKLTLEPLFNPDSNYLHDFREVERIDGNLNDYERVAEFAVSIASSERKNAVFLIGNDAPTVQKYLEGHTLMASESNRTYWILPERETANALQLVGLSELPVWDD